jgi:Protein of unknown function (DUF2949)
MSQTDLPKLIDFLHLNLNLPDDSVRLALKKSQPNYSNLPVVMWQYGLVNLPELNKIYDWFESYVY